MPDRDDFDAFLGDMAGHQTVHVGEVTPRSNQEMARAVFDRLDQKIAAQSQRMQSKPAPPPVSTEPRASDVEAQRRGWRVLRDDDFAAKSTPGGDIPVVSTWGKRDQQLYAAMRVRIAVLLEAREPGILGAPSWRDRALSVLAVAMAGQKRLAAHQMFALCRESEATFGPIVSPRDRKIIVGAG